MNKVFIVILNWNKPKLTIDCVQSVLKSRVQGVECKIVIVDNGSTDNSLEEFRKLISNKKFQIKVVGTGSNLGFAGGNNFGIKYALENGATHVLVLNNDTLVDGGLVSEMMKTMEFDPGIGIVSPKIYFAKGFEFHKDRYKKNQLGKVLWYAGGKMDWKNVIGTNRGVDEVDKGQYQRLSEIDFATGACMMARVKALKEVGLFDEKYFMYLEDADLSQRIKTKGWKVVYEPKAKLWHKVAQSSGIGSNLNDYYISRNRLLFGFKFASLRTKIALLRESLRIFIYGRHWQAVGVRDFYLRKFGKGSWQ